MFSETLVSIRYIVRYLLHICCWIRHCSWPKHNNHITSVRRGHVFLSTNRTHLASSRTFFFRGRVKLLRAYLWSFYRRRNLWEPSGASTRRDCILIRFSNLHAAFPYVDQLVVVG